MLRSSLTLLVCAACQSAPAQPDAADALCFDMQGLRAPTFANVQQILTAECITCHSASLAPDLSAPAYANLVGKSAADDPPFLDSCGGTLVVSGDPARSYLYVKVSSDVPCAGSRMPRGEFVAGRLADCQVDLIQRWILAGAPND